MEPATWLTLRDGDRRAAVKQAASRLLDQHRRRWPNLVPIELHRLAWCLDARIVRVAGLEGEAHLVPSKGGFQVFVRDRLSKARSRTSVAHELVHTLFYCKDTDPPKRLLDHSDAEEHFCFDVARRILAPDWLIEQAQIQEMDDPQKAFRLLIDPAGAFQLSRPVAARVMFDDYQLATGVAARWVARDGEWTRQSASGAVTRGLPRKERLSLWRVAKRWLADEKEPMGYQVLGIRERGGQSAFVAVFRMY